MPIQLTASFSHPVDALGREFRATIGKHADDEYTAQQLDHLRMAWDGLSITGPAHIVMRFIGAMADDGDDSLIEVKVAAEGGFRIIPIFTYESDDSKRDFVQYGRTIFDEFGITEKDIVQYGGSVLFRHDGTIYECPINADGSRCYDVGYWYEVDFDRIDEEDAAQVRALFAD